MPGPVSFPTGPKSRYEELNDIVCNNHFNCDMLELDKHGDEVKHDYITYREWLARRGRLTTGKSMC